MTAFSSPPGVAARLSLLQGLTFLSIGVSLPFFPLWLSSRGVSDVEIGLLLTIPIVARIFAASAVAGLGDGRVAPLLLLAGLNGVAMLLSLVLAWQSDPWIIGALMAVTAVATAGVIPLVDSLTTAQIRIGRGIDYGCVRLWGSVCFFAANLIGGALVARHGAGIVPLAIAACFGMAALSALAAPPPPDRLVRPVAAGESPARFGAAFWWTILAFASINATHAALYAFGSLHWRNLGYGDEAIGGFWAVGVAAEILLFLYAGGIVAKGVDGLVWIAVGAVAAAIRFGLMALDPGPAGMLALQALHGASFGCLHLGAMAVVSALAPDGRRAAAQGRLVAASALASGAATMISGPLFQNHGSLVFLAMTPLAVLGYVFAALAKRNLRGDTS
jgi:PPP family 3-phenylpropionic acid transporter